MEGKEKEEEKKKEERQEEEEVRAFEAAMTDEVMPNRCECALSAAE